MRPARREQTNPPLQLLLRDTNKTSSPRIQGNPPKIPDRFVSVANFTVLAQIYFLNVPRGENS